MVNTEIEVKDVLTQEPRLKKQRLRAFNNLQAYFGAFYQEIKVNFPNYIPLMAALMVQDTEGSGSLVSGPVPLFLSLDPENREEFGIADYRQLNDSDVAIVKIRAEEVNQRSLEVLMKLNPAQLQRLNRDLPAIMTKFSRAPREAELLDAWEQEIKRNPKWQNDDALDFKRETLAGAMQALGSAFFDHLKLLQIHA